MSVFNRNDKTPEPVQPAPAPARVETPPPAAAAAVTEIRRPQPEPAPRPVPAAGSRGVSVISKALKITGQLESTEDIQIDGQVEGDVRAASVKVGTEAKVKGSVFGDEVELSGSVEGKIEARKVVLTSSAHMTGDVVHQDITIHSGAYVAGHLRPEFGKKSE